MLRRLHTVAENKTIEHALGVPLDVGMQSGTNESRILPTER